ncbi:MAG TPA: DoxX family protein [Vampirovibrionales bacterium]
MFLNNLNNYSNIGLFILRIGIGVMFILHGYPKIMGGPEKWEALGGVMSMIGINYAPTFWGFMAAFAEFAGGILLVLGFLFRPACLLLLGTMAMATTMHVLKGDGFNDFSHALEAGILFFSLIFIGPGTISLDGKLMKKH